MKQCKCLLLGCYVTIKAHNLNKSCPAAQNLGKHPVIYRRIHHRSLSASSSCSKAETVLQMQQQPHLRGKKTNMHGAEQTDTVAVHSV